MACSWTSPSSHNTPSLLDICHPEGVCIWVESIAKMCNCYLLKTVGKNGKILAALFNSNWLATYLGICKCSFTCMQTFWVVSCSIKHVHCSCYPNRKNLRTSGDQVKEALPSEGGTRLRTEETSIPKLKDELDSGDVLLGDEVNKWKECCCIL